MEPITYRVEGSLVLDVLKLKAFSNEDFIQIPLLSTELDLLAQMGFFMLQFNDFRCYQGKYWIASNECIIVYI